MNVDAVLRPLYGEQASDKSTNDGFASHEVNGVMQVQKREFGIFEPVEEF